MGTKNKPAVIEPTLTDLLARIAVLEETAKITEQIPAYKAIREDARQRLEYENLCRTAVDLAAMETEARGKVFMALSEYQRRRVAEIVDAKQFLRGFSSNDSVAQCFLQCQPEYRQLALIFGAVKPAKRVGVRLANHNPGHRRESIWFPLEDGSKFTILASGQSVMTEREWTKLQKNVYLAAKIADGVEFVVEPVSAERSQQIELEEFRREGRSIAQAPVVQF